jgi:amino acid transporter
MIITIILSIIQLGSSEAFNSILGLAGAAVQFSYTISIGCVLWRRFFGRPLPYARWSLGRFGIPINIAGCLFQAFCCTISFFPQYADVTA